MSKAVSVCFGLAMASMIAAAPAFAQKSKDTLRIAANDQFAVLSPYDLPLDEAGPIYNSMYSTLWSYDGNSHQYVSQLAKSWTHVDPTTIDIELYDDVTLHTGKHFDADDVKAPLDYAIDPKTNIRSQYRYTWIKSVEKLGPYKLRFHLVAPYALDILAIAERIFAEDSQVLGKLDSKADYGRLSAASAGPYKLVSLDLSKGAVVERFDKLSPHLQKFQRAPIKRIEISTITEPQTQVAELLTGGLDVVHNVTEATAEELAKNPNIVIDNTSSQEFFYLTMDAIGRSGRNEFKDIRVRKAVEMAIDRDSLVKHIVAGGAAAQTMDSLCFDFTIACSASTKPYAYNPEEAKKLLAEAGYPNGFDMVLHAHAPAKELAEAISGDLRKVGITMHVQPETIAVYTKLRGEGKLNAFVGIRPTADFPETSDILGSFFRGERDYWQDQTIIDTTAAGEQVADDAARAKVLQTAIDRNNTEAYVFPISSMPIVYAHSKDVRIAADELYVNTVFISDYYWK